MQNDENPPRQLENPRGVWSIITCATCNQCTEPVGHSVVAGKLWKSRPGSTKPSILQRNRRPQNGNANRRRQALPDANSTAEGGCATFAELDYACSPDLTIGEQSGSNAWKTEYRAAPRRPYFFSSFMRPSRVSRSVSAHGFAELNVIFLQRAGNAQLAGVGLAGDAAAVDAE